MIKYYQSVTRYWIEQNSRSSPSRHHYMRTSSIDPSFLQLSNAALMSNIVMGAIFVADSPNFYERTDMPRPCIVISKGDANGVCNVFSEARSNNEIQTNQREWEQSRHQLWLVSPREDQSGHSKAGYISWHPAL